MMATSERESILNKILPNILKHTDLKEYKIESMKQIKVNDMSSDNNFMISSLFTCTILFSDGNKLNFVVKILDQDMFIQKTFGMDKMFANEIIAYNTVINSLDLQNLFPRCYYFSERGAPIIVMQDIRMSGYRMTDSMTWLSKEHISLAVKKLGMFHGRGYTLKESNLEEFLRICSLFQEIRYLEEPTEDSSINMVYEVCAQRGLKALQSEFSDDPEMQKFIDEMQKLFVNALEYARELIKPSSPISVLCHGDYLRNNVMYSYDNMNRPVNLMMIDLQTFRYASPATDLSVFLMMHYDAKQLIEDWDYFFNEYHEALIGELCTVLDKPISDLPSAYSKTNIGRDFARYCLHGYYVASYFLGCLHEPLTEDPAEYFAKAKPEEILEDTMTRGGEPVTKSLSNILLFVKYIQNKYNYRNF